MGQCHSAESYPKPGFRLQELADLPLHTSRDYPRGCTPSIGGSQGGSGYAWCLQRGFDWPKNGEFQFTLGSGCSMCSDVGGGYGCECGGSVGGGASIGGSRCAVTRTQYLADPMSCCLRQDGASILGDRTCNPIYRGPNTPACREKLRGYCDDKRNFFSPVCREFIGNLNEQYKNTLAVKHCAQEGLSPDEEEWCACFRAKPPVEFRDDPVLKSLFLCLDEKCLGGKNPRALKPFAFECPTTFVHCRQDVAQKLADSGIKKQAIQQQCGNVNLFPEKEEEEKDEDEPAPVMSSQWIILFIILGIAAAALTAGILIFRRRQK